MTIDKYKLFSPIGGRTVSHMELATIFFVTCCDVYLSENGTIAFVMPKSIFNAEHHEGFRKGNLSKVQFGIIKTYDAEGIHPLFNIPSCVVFAKKIVQRSIQ
jgi:hypothetical protein